MICLYPARSKLYAEQSPEVVIEEQVLRIQLLAYLMEALDTLWIMDICRVADGSAQRLIDMWDTAMKERNLIESQAKCLPRGIC
jgi:hypothetical protein